MEDVLGVIVGYIVIILFFIGFISLIISGYLHFKMQKIIEEKYPDLADIVYGFNFRSFYWKNWKKIIKFNNADYPDIAEHVKKRNVFIWAAVISGAGIVLVMIITLIILMYT